MRGSRGVSPFRVVAFSALALVSAAGIRAAGAAEAVSASVRYDKLQAVLSHLGVADERDYYGNDLRGLERAQTREGFERILGFLDPTGQLQRYLRWDDSRVTVYRDRDSRERPDYSVAFAAREGAPADLEGLRAALAAASENPADQPLRGLRVALDPGHMGGHFWDVKTGKYVEIPELGTVSEGVIAFQACMLLKAELEKLGAEAMITRKGLGPVTEESLEAYDLRPWADRELRNSADEPWFESLLDSAPLGSALFAAVDASRDVARLRSARQRDNYFISRLDLAARAAKITAFRPHLTLVVHYDASELHKLQDARDSVRGYVMGNVFANEAGSREMRAAAVRGLLSGVHWDESVAFTGTVVRSVSENIRVATLTSPTDYQAIRVADGVYARNLALNRLVTAGAMTYIEILHYDYTPEFRSLLTLDRHATVDGVVLDYPSRLDPIVAGLREGVLNYVASFGSRAGHGGSALP